MIKFQSVIKYFYLKFRKDPIIIILILAFILRLMHLGGRDIWYDEALDVAQSEKPVFQIIKDVQTPLHYLIVHFFLIFGKNTLILGLPSVIFGIGTVYLVYLLGKKIADEKTGVISALLVSLSPMLIEFSQQILHYSYFVFFTTLSLYFYLDLLENFQSGKTKIINILLFLLVSWMNILTHASAFLVLLLQGSFAVITLLLSGKVAKFANRHLVWIIIASVILGVAVLMVGNFGYLSTFKTISLNTSKAMSVGYSLEGQLGSKLLVFNSKFFFTVMRWFGQGGGFRLWIYMLLFGLGIVSLLRSKKYITSIFSVYWIVSPFIFLYFFRTEHWFEEKYFFFIVPMYLASISSGIIMLADTTSTFILNFNKKIKIGKSNKTKLKNYTMYAILGTLILLSIKPISIRTIYGFRRSGDPAYSWKTAINYAKNMSSPEDIFIVPNGEGVFMNYYFQNTDKNKRWFEERYILSLDADGYDNLIKQNKKIYFISIPDFNDLFLASIADSKYIAKLGGFNINEIKFKKNSENIINKNSAGLWEYYDDYRTAKFISDASERINITSSYIGNYNLPNTYGYFNLSPFEATNSSILYKFQIPDNEDFNIKITHSISPNYSLKTYGGEDGEVYPLLLSEVSDKSILHDDIIKVRGTSKRGVRKYNLKIVLEKLTGEPDNGESSIKSLLLTNKNINSGVEFPVTEDNTLSYFTQLEVARSNKWLFDSIQNFGWIQATDGILFNHWNDGKPSPLIYKFRYAVQLKPQLIKIKSFTFDNELKIYASSNGEKWIELSTISDNEKKDRNIEINKLDTNGILFIKFICLKTGPTCQVRDFSLDFIGE